MNNIKFQTPFERMKLYNNCPYILLRKAIIVQALIDATNNAKSKASQKLKKEAKAWIFNNGEYFNQTCQEAGMEPSFVIRITKKLIELNTGISEKEILQKLYSS
jgi:hypothetical protein